MPRLASFLAAPVGALLLQSSAVAETLVSLECRDLDEVRVVGFELDRPAKIDIDAVGLRPYYSSELTGYAWLLDSSTREPIWVMDSRGSSRMKASDRNSDRNNRDDRYDRDDILRRASKSLTLEPGRYELYLFAGTHGESSDGNFQFIGFRDIGHFLRGHSFHTNSWNSDDVDLRSALRDCHVTLSSNDLSKGNLREFEVTGDMPGALIRHNRLGNSQFVQEGIRLDRPMSLRIHALIEEPKGYENGADYAWIVEADTRKRVWETTRRNTDEAGGSSKNRLFDGEVQLDRGSYVLYYGTDDSHSFEQFNANPPFDPYNWGITVLPGKEFDRAAFHTFDAARGKPLVDMRRMHDGDFRQQAFQLAHEATVQVYALGEFAGRDDDFADRGWITRAGGDETVWKMTEENTVGAGGAEKNRMFDGTVRLPAGEYVAYYACDDSHSYDDWNSAAPIDQEAWGLSIYPGPDMRESELQLVSEPDADKNPDVLVRMIRMGDRAHSHKEFTLDRPTRVRIYAIGEGSHGQMYDYGYIQSRDHDDPVWEMTWRNTHHAGGAEKNRVFDGELMLEAGTYEVNYESDGSHSFRGWNAAMPDDPMHWGVTVSVAK